MKLGILNQRADQDGVGDVGKVVTQTSMLAERVVLEEIIQGVRFVKLRVLPIYHLIWGGLRFRRREERRGERERERPGRAFAWVVMVPEEEM